MKRLLLLLAAVGIVVYLVKTQGLLTKTTAADPRGSPIDRARSAAATSDARTSAGDTVAREADQPMTGSGSVTENMTPDQVRALLGTPDDVSTETTSSGATRETWTYRSVGKTVVFENGVAVSVR
jgi:hypothetical protein